MKINTGWDCFICGAEVVVETSAEQKCQCEEPEGCECEDAAWWASEGDPTTCPECGAVGWVSVDGDWWEGCYHGYDEEAPVNVAAYEKHEQERAKRDTGPYPDGAA